jgi:hypothetical protein
LICPIEALNAAIGLRIKAEAKASEADFAKRPALKTRFRTRCELQQVVDVGWYFVALEAKLLHNNCDAASDRKPGTDICKSTQ